jgi:hypothetical protein
MLDTIKRREELEELMRFVQDRFPKLEHTLNAFKKTAWIVDKRRYPRGRSKSGNRNLTWKSKNQSPMLLDPFLSD